MEERQQRMRKQLEKLNLAEDWVEQAVDEAAYLTDDQVSLVIRITNAAYDEGVESTNV